MSILCVTAHTPLTLRLLFPAIRTWRSSSALLRLEIGVVVIPAQAGIQIAPLDSRLRGNDDDAPDERGHPFVSQS